jgi:hypothetical protein
VEDLPGALTPELVGKKEVVAVDCKDLLDQ